MQRQYKRGSAEDRFWAKVDKSGDCWEWQGARTPQGYGRFGVKRGEMVYAHRFAYELVRGSIDTGTYILHTCDNPPCVNPNHLFIGSPRDNMRDMIEKGRAKHTKGIAHGAAKLTDAQVAEIRRMGATGMASRTIAENFPVGHRHVSRILSGERRKL